MDSNYMGISIHQLESDIIKFSLSLYSDPSITKKLVDEILKFLNDFISVSLIPFFQKQMVEKLSASKEVLSTALFLLESNKNLLSNFTSEHMRFKTFEEKFSYIPPKLVKVGDILKETKDEEGLIVDMYKPVYIAEVPLRYTFKALLEKKNLFSEVLRFMKSLSEDGTVLSNIIQGDLWIKKYHDSEKIVLPFFIFIDDFETRNPLGSRSGNQKLTGVYAVPAFLPPHISAKLENVLVANVVRSKHLKTLGNLLIFSNLIDEINFLSEQGIEIIVENKRYKVFLEVPLVIGDNLGLNTVCGFSGSFSATFYCRICLAPNFECQVMTEEDEKLLRNIESYEKAIMINNLKSIGMNEECVFDHIKKFNIVENVTVDVMHDLFEGVSAYTVGKILESLIKKKIITLKVINHRIKTFDYGDLEKKNKPQVLVFSKGKKGAEKLKIRQSAAELLCLVRYLGIIIGDLIPIDSEEWQLYLHLRKIIGITTSPALIKGQIFNLKGHIKNHNALYLKIFGKLKPKMHLLLHYVRIMLLNGPVFHFSAMKCERKNKKIKDFAVTSSSNVNLPITVAIRHQLQMAYDLSFHTISIQDYEIGSVHEENSYEIFKRIIPNIPPKTTVKSLKNVFILNKSLQVGSICVLEITDNGPRFGMINNIFYVGNDVFFQVKEFYVISFDQHFYAYHVYSKVDDPYLLINISRIIRTSPCMKIDKNGENFIVTRYDL